MLRIRDIEICGSARSPARALAHNDCRENAVLFVAPESVGCLHMCGPVLISFGWTRRQDVVIAAGRSGVSPDDAKSGSALLCAPASPLQSPLFRVAASQTLTNRTIMWPIIVKF